MDSSLVLTLKAQFSALVLLIVLTLQIQSMGNLLTLLTTTLY